MLSNLSFSLLIWCLCFCMHKIDLCQVLFHARILLERLYSLNKTSFELLYLVEASKQCKVCMGVLH